MTFPVKGARTMPPPLPALIERNRDAGPSFSNEMEVALGRFGERTSDVNSDIDQTVFDDPAPTYETIVQSSMSMAYTPPFHKPSPTMAGQENHKDNSSPNYDIPEAEAENEDESQLPYVDSSKKERKVKFVSESMEIQGSLSGGEPMSSIPPPSPSVSSGASNGEQ
jgi:hypothetical protein